MDPAFDKKLNKRFAEFDTKLAESFAKADRCLRDSSVKATKFQETTEGARPTRFRMRAVQATEVEVEITHPETFQKITRIFRETQIIPDTEVYDAEQLRVKLRELKTSLSDEEIDHLSDEEIQVAAETASNAE